MDGTVVWPLLGVAFGALCAAGGVLWSDWWLLAAAISAWSASAWVITEPP